MNSLNAIMTLINIGVIIYSFTNLFKFKKYIKNFRDENNKTLNKYIEENVELRKENEELLLKNEILEEALLNADIKIDAGVSES